MDGEQGCGMDGCGVEFREFELVKKLLLQVCKGDQLSRVPSISRETNPPDARM